MITMLLSFLGSAFFRLVVDRVLTMGEASQNHKHELEMLGMQLKIGEQRHAFRLEEIDRVAEMQELVELIKAMAVAHKADAKMTGIGWVDAWRQIMRPAIATLVALPFFVGRFIEIWHAGRYDMTEFDQALTGAVFGYYFMDRTLTKRHERRRTFG